MEIVKDEKLSEGKTKIIYAVQGNPGLCVMFAKERITAFNSARSNELVGKAAVSNHTTSLVFEYLQRAGIRCAFERALDDVSLLARRCQMIPIEFVCRRVATGSFLKRHPGVQEGLRFVPLKSETFFKDDAKDDPQVSKEQIVAMCLPCGGRRVTANDVDIMMGTTEAVFEILERAWHHLDCALIDMKVEYGADAETGELLLADVIDSDSWRLWPGGDKRLMVDKQVYRDMAEVTDEGLRAVLRNFQWVADKLPAFLAPPRGRVIIAMGSATDAEHCRAIAKELRRLGVDQCLAWTWCYLFDELSHGSGAIDILKIDIEYMDWEVLEQALKDGCLSRVKQLILETHTAGLHGKQSDYASFIRILAGIFDLGFLTWKWYEASVSGLLQV